MHKVLISASSLPAGRNMSAQLEYVQRVGSYGADIYHLDVMDGSYTKFKTINDEYIEQLRVNSALLFEAHLMVSEPDKVIDKYLKTSVSLIYIHVEVLDDENLKKIIKKIKRAKKMVGLVVDLDTDVKKVEPYLDFIDAVLVMTVKAGKGGQAFNEKALNKIKYIRKINKKVLIEVDGGINPETGAKCVKAGADILVSGNYIYKNDAYEAIQALRGKNG